MLFLDSSSSFCAIIVILITSIYVTKPTGGSDQDHPQEKEMQIGKMVVWGGLTNSWEMKIS